MPFSKALPIMLHSLLIMLFFSLDPKHSVIKRFHQNPLKNVGGVAKTRTSVDKMAKTDKGPSLW